MRSIDFSYETFSLESLYRCIVVGVHYFNTFIFHFRLQYGLLDLGGGGGYRYMIAVKGHWSCYLYIISEPGNGTSSWYHFLNRNCFFGGKHFSRFFYGGSVFPGSVRKPVSFNRKSCRRSRYGAPAQERSFARQPSHPESETVRVRHRTKRSRPETNRQIFKAASTLSTGRFQACLPHPPPSSSFLIIRSRTPRGVVFQLQISFFSAKS
jgi:hypothetical protein